MFLESVGTLLVALAMGVAIVFVNTIIKTVASRRDFEIRSDGLKVRDEFSIWAGHVNSLLLADGLIYKMHETFKRLNAKTVGWLYGTRKAVITMELDLIKRMIVDNQETDRISLNSPFKEIEFDCILTAKGEQWQRIRKAVAPALKSNKFKTANVQREIDSSIGKLVRAIESKLEASGSGNIEMNFEDYAHRYSLDLVFSCFYKQDNLIDFDAKVDPMTQLINSGLEDLMWNPVIRMAIIFPVIRSLVDWLIMTFHPQGAWRSRIMEFVKRQTMLNFEARRHLDESRKLGKQVNDEDSFLLQDGTKFNRNMIDHVIDQFYEGKLHKAEYFHTAWFLMGAADKTASDSIAHTIYQLATHLDIQDKLRKSIQAEGVECEYLSWVISESLRILPPAPVGCSRMTSRDYKCEGGLVPKGTFVVAAVYSIHRLKEYWGPDADEFRPERFAAAQGFHPMQFIPFGAGARGCPGKEFAMHEMKKLICTLLTRYKFKCETVAELRYNSPWLMFMIPNKDVHVTVSRV